MKKYTNTLLFLQDLKKLKNKSFKIINYFEGMSLKKEKECIICCDDNENMFHELSCGHEFHYKCILDWVESKYGNGVINCPVCRKEVKAKDIDLHAISLNGTRLNYIALKNVNSLTKKEHLLDAIKNVKPEFLDCLKKDEKSLTQVQKYCPLLYCYLVLNEKMFDIITDMHFRTMDAVNYDGAQHLLEKQKEEQEMEARVFLNSCPEDILKSEGVIHLVDMGLAHDIALLFVDEEIQKRNIRKQMEEERNLPRKKSRWVRNPITGRAIKRFGPTYKKIVRQYCYSDNDFTSLIG